MGIRSDWSQLRPWAKAFLLHPMVVFAMFPFLNFNKETLFGVDEPELVILRYAAYAVCYRQS